VHLLPSIYVAQNGKPRHLEQ